MKQKGKRGGRSKDLRERKSSVKIVDLHLPILGSEQMKLFVETVGISLRRRNNKW